MWKLTCPKLQDALDDIDKVIKLQRDLDISDKNSIRDIYTAYHRQNGYLDIAQDQNLPEVKRRALKRAYEKTYQNKDLNYIRVELQRGVTKCPFCSIGEVSQLDHYQPKSLYNSIAVCRLNLVPTCGVCNNKKDTTQSFTHAYYDVFPQTDFLIADISICGKGLSVTFKLDSGLPSDLKARMENQMNILELHDRLQKEVTTFIFDRFYFYPKSDEELSIFLDTLRQQIMGIYGRNDWRTALIRGLQDCPQFNVKFLRSYIDCLNKSTSIERA